MIPQTIVAPQNGDYDLATGATVFDANPLDATNARLCQLYLAVGDGVKNLTGAGGSFTMTLTVGLQVIQPSLQAMTFGADARAGLYSMAQFVVPANTRLRAYLKSPNAGDSSVDVTVTTYDVSVADVRSLKGTALTETTPGDLAASFNAFFGLGILQNGTKSVAQMMKEIWGKSVGEFAVAGGVIHYYNDDGIVGGHIIFNHTPTDTQRTIT